MSNGSFNCVNEQKRQVEAFHTRGNVNCARIIYNSQPVPALEFPGALLGSFNKERSAKTQLRDTVVST